MKVFLLLSVAGLITYIGWAFSHYYKKRALFFEDLIQFCNVFENDLKFSRNTIANVVKQNIKLFHKPFADTLENYFTKQMPVNSMLLKEHENVLLNQFFGSLGKSDEEGEVRNLNNYKIEFVRIKEKTSSDNIRFGSLSLKMGAIVGALVFVVFI